jgi:hypothetical protein
VGRDGSRGGDGDDSVRHSTYGTFDGGAGNDRSNSVYAGSGAGVFDGGPGNDSTGDIGEDATFIGGEGDDTAFAVSPRGSFLGGDGADSVTRISSREGQEGLFDGGPGNDLAGSVDGRFLGGAGADVAPTVGVDGIFWAGDGNDQVTDLYGIFAGEAGDDRVGTVFATGRFYGGDDVDTANGCYPGAFLIADEPVHVVVRVGSSGEHDLVTRTSSADHARGIEVRRDRERGTRDAEDPAPADEHGPSDCPARGCVPS